MAEPDKLIKLTMYCKRKTDMSEEEFHQYWSEKHPLVVNDWLKKHGFVRYVQYHTTSALRSQAQKELQSLGELFTDKMLDYDGIVELVMPDIKCVYNARKDPYCAEHVAPDEESFADIVAVTVGYEEQKF